MIQIRDISKRYGDIQALQDVNLHINRGELFGLIGPDGAGKTTLFRILATLLHPDSGTASMCGLDCVADYRQLRREIGYMPGKFSLYLDLTIEENLNFYASIFGVKPSEGLRLVEPIYKQIEPFKHRRAGKLSGGMKQKLALCCALIHKPKVLLLDEPTTGVDAVSRQEFWDMLDELRRSGITIFVSTPYMDEADRCDRIALINRGSILEQGTPRQIVERHLPGVEVDRRCGRQIEEVFVRLMSGATFNIQADRVTQSPSNVIQVKNLVKRFGDFTAVDNISFNVGRGEIFGFLGANGAGKTTAMRCLCGLSYPTEGTARVAGFDAATQAEQIKRHIGYMSQRFSLYDDLTVWENIELFGGIYGLSGDQLKRRGREILTDLGMHDHTSKLVADLPLGWKQKLAFSIAMLHNPDIVFLDEPTGGVDPVARRQFWQLIYETAARGTTIFVTTHYMDEAEYCDRVSIMVDGRIEAIGSPRELKQQFGVESIDEVFRRLARKSEKEVQ